MRIKEIVMKILRNNYFIAGDNFYRQKKGVAMGSVVGPVLADMAIAPADQLISNIKGVLYFGRYVDDVIVLYDMSMTNVKFIKDIANSYHTDIKFTVEEEKNGCLPFLDVVITRNDNSLTFKSYKKQCYVDVLMNYRSLVPEHVKMNSFRMDLNKIYNRTSKWEDQMDEYQQLLKSMLNNGYPIKKLDSWYQIWCNKKDENVSKKDEKNSYKKVLAIYHMCNLCIKKFKIFLKV